VSGDASGPEAAGFVLAGGRSSRMGRDKALLELGSKPLVAHALGILRAAGFEASIAGGDPSLASFAPLVPDRLPDLGPLSGICNALASAPAPWAVFASVDAPFLPSSLLECLLLHAQITGSPVTICSLNGFAQTFPAVVSRAAHPWLACELEAGRRGCFSAFQAAAAALHHPVSVLPAEVLVQCGQVAHPQALPPVRWFMNVNTEEEFERAQLQWNALTASVVRVS
jgi:molybdopterin-guanine dinucleotide biosynthesis protein A